jgi:hypothetical protein
MCRVRRDVQVQIERFLVKTCHNALVFQCERKVQEVDGRGPLGKFPSKLPERHCGLKLDPIPFVDCRVFIRYPQSDHVVDIPFIKRDCRLELW